MNLCLSTQAWSLIGATSLSALIGACQAHQAAPTQAPQAGPPTFWSEEPWMEGTREVAISQTAPKMEQTGATYDFQMCLREADGQAEIDRKAYLNMMYWWKIATPAGQTCKERINAYLNPPPQQSTDTEATRIELGNGYSIATSTQRPGISARRVLTAFIAHWEQNEGDKGADRIRSSATHTPCELRSRFDNERIYEGRIINVSVNFEGAQFMCGVDSTGQTTYKDPE